MELSDILSRYRNDITVAKSYISFAFSQNSSGQYMYREDIRNFITDNAFLKMFISWEGFLEDSFLSYMMGKKSIKGNLVNRYVTPIDRNHAQKILIGTQKYLDWANPEIVRRVALLYFENGDPFNNILSSINADLLDLKTIRNGAAHLSSTTQSQIDAVASRKLSRPCSNINVSGLVLEVDPIDNSRTILDYYILVLDAAAERIANL